MAQVNMERVERVLKNLEASHADAQILINDPWSIYYLTGFMPICSSAFVVYYLRAAKSPSSWLTLCIS